MRALLLAAMLVTVAAVVPTLASAHEVRCSVFDAPCIAQCLVDHRNQLPFLLLTSTFGDHCVLVNP